MNRRQAGQQDRVIAARDIDPLESQLKIFKGISLCAGILFGIFGLVFALLARTEILKAKTDFLNVVENWEAPFIFDLNLVANGGACPGNLTKMVFGTWPGTSYGCDCRGISYFLARAYEVSSRTLSSGSCSYNESMAGCLDISPTQAQDLSSWRNNAVFCAKTYKDINFVKIADKFEDDKDCIANTIKCGLNHTHSVCLPNWIMDCPVSSVKLQKRLLQESDGKDYSLQISRNESMPLTELRVAWEAVCFDNDVVRYPGTLANYPLLYGHARDECKEIDERFVAFDVLDETKLLVNNRVPYRQLPLFRVQLESINPQMTMFYRSLINWKIDCRVHMDTVVGHQNDIIMVSQYQDYLVVCTVINFIFLTILYPCLEMCLIILPDNPAVARRPRAFGILGLPQGQAWCMICVSIVGWLSKIGQFVFFYLTMTVSASVMNFFSEIASLKCSDNLTNGTFDHLSKILKEDAYAHNRQGFYIELFFVIVNILAVVREIVLELAIRHKYQILDVQSINDNLEMQRLDNDANNRLEGMRLA